MNWLIKISQNPQLPSLRILQSLRSKMAISAQAVYDEWKQDKEGYDELLGGGGICDQIAEAFMGVLSGAGFEVQDGGQDGDDHAYVVVKTPEGYYNVDIYPGKYESGGGYNWKKIPDVHFSPEDVDIDFLGNDSDYWAPEGY